MITTAIRILGSTEADGLLAGRSRVMAEAEAAVAPILDDVANRGDDALREYARRFDGFQGNEFVAPPEELNAAAEGCDDAFLAAVAEAKANVEQFARLQLPREFIEEPSPGRRVGQIVRPLETVAAYVPGGRYPLPSTVVMTVVPAKVAGVPNVWVTSPRANRETDAAASICDASRVARLGGAHAIAGFAFGTQTLPKADRIVGPGNAYVAAAKKLLAGTVGIDFVAGPTEVMIVANEGQAAWIAADMLAQAEHDPDAASLLLTTSPALAQAVAAQIDRQLADLPTRDAAARSIQAHGAIVLTGSDSESMELVNRFAPEHLCLHDPSLVGSVVNAGSVFLGAHSPEAAGDYASGPNHVLPTAGAARVHGGLSVLDFLKVITVQDLSREALASIAPSAITLARAEGLEAHARSIEVRLA